MWQQEKKDSVIVNLGLLLALATTPLTTNLLLSAPVVAESIPDTANFPQPQTVEKGTIVRIDSSTNLAMINQSLKDSFEKQFSSTQVEVATNGTETALKALVDGKIDIAAIGRRLTPAEKSQGLEQVRLYREKVAIIVGVNNPFKGSLTSEQFAKIFRGEITDWSELGEASGKIRFIDRPETSDTRNSFRDYPVFKSSKFSTGANAIQVPEDNTAQIVKQLGTDGISYAIANQVSQLQDVRILKIQEISQDSSKYPFSQPLVYAYKQNFSTLTASFLGFTTATTGQKTIEAAREAEASAIAASALQVLNPETPISLTPVAATSPDNNLIAATTAPTTTNSGNAQQFVNPLDDNPIGQRNVIFVIMLSLLPVIGLGGFLTWWLTKRKRSLNQTADSPETSIPSLLDSTQITSSTPDDNYSIIPPENNTTTTNGKYNSDQNSITIISNTEENPTPAATETSAGNVSTLTAEETNLTAGNTDNLDIIALDCGEVVWDTEAPVAVVNTSYPSVANIPEISFDDIELPTDEFTGSLSELLDQPQASSYLESTTSLSELLDESVPISHQNVTSPLSEAIGLPTNSNQDDFSASLLELLDVPTISPNAEFNTSPLNSLTTSPPQSNQESINSLSELLGLPPEELELDIDTEEISDKSINSQSNLSNDLGEEFFNTVADEAELNADFADPVSSNSFSPTNLLELVHDQSALNQSVEIEDLYHSDSIQDHAPLDLQEQTDILDTPSSFDINLDTNPDNSITFTPRTPKWAYVSWDVSETQKEVLRKQEGTLLALRIYDATDIDLSYQIPQLVQQYQCEEATHECYVAIPTDNRDYVTEIGYVTNSNKWLCLARSATVRVFKRPNTDFWFVTDTELVIRGATEPGATVTIDGHIIKPEPDGTFHFRVPFTESLLNYLLTATAANGEKSKTIHQKFSQESSEY
jgi:phosphate transport system substrate-binding protein